MLTTHNTMLIVIDVQGKLAESMHNKDQLLDNLSKLIQGIRVLSLPIIVTEQYPKGLGPTLPAIASLLPEDTQPISKMHFSCCGDEHFMHVLNVLNRNQLVVAGIEAHVCVYQTAVDLRARGYEVEIVADAISSRTASNKEIGLTKMRERGVSITSVEMVLFELMRVAGGDAFRAIQNIIK